MEYIHLVKYIVALKCFRFFDVFVTIIEQIILILIENLNEECERNRINTATW